MENYKEEKMTLTKSYLEILCEKSKIGIITFYRII